MYSEMHADSKQQHGNWYSFQHDHMWPVKSPVRLDNVWWLAIVSNYNVNVYYYWMHKPKAWFSLVIQAQVQAQ